MMIVVIENDENWLKKTVKDINEELSSNNIDENIICFKKYTKELRNIIYDNNKKIYVLDIELGDSSGYDIAREIRDEANDWDSVIIISSIYNQKENIISDRLSVLTYISKLTNFDDNLKTSIRLAINIVAKNNFFEFKESGINYKIAISSIIYIKKEKYSKYCIIKTINGFFRIRDTIVNLKDKTRLIQLKKDLLVNEKYINDTNNIDKI